jgi:DNA polymerase IV
VTRARLAATGIRTVGELAAAPGPFLERLLGHAAGEKLGSLAVNADARRIETTRRARSMGAQGALGRRTATPDVLRSSLGYLTDRVASRLRAARRGGRTITVRVRFTGMRSVTRSVTLPAAVSTTTTITELAVELAASALDDHPSEREITLLAVSVSNLVDEAALQLELALGLEDERRRPGTALGAARWALDRAMDSVRDRFGRDSVGYAAVVFSDVARVPEAFRELAEHGHAETDDVP